MEWTDRYNNPKTTEFQTLAGKVEASVGKCFNKHSKKLKTLNVSLMSILINISIT